MLITFQIKKIEKPSNSKHFDKFITTSLFKVSDLLSFICRLIPFTFLLCYTVNLNYTEIQYKSVYSYAYFDNWKLLGRKLVSNKLYHINSGIKQLLIILFSSHPDRWNTSIEKATMHPAVWWAFMTGLLMFPISIMTKVRISTLRLDFLPMIQYYRLLHDLKQKSKRRSQKTSHHAPRNSKPFDLMSCHHTFSKHYCAAFTFC